MEIKSQTNTFEGGMDMDTDVAYAASNTYRYAENVRIITNENGTNGILQNIEYIRKYEKIDKLKDQNILYAISAQLPNENEELENTAIILTQDKTNTGRNHIYLVTGFNTQILNCICVLKILWNLNKDSGVTMIYNYETRSVYKLYVNYPSTGLKIINLADYRTEFTGEGLPSGSVVDGVIQDSSYFNSQPTATLPPLKLNSYINGNLKVGAYQYFYKLYTDTGIESTLSSGSELIYLGRPNISNSSEATGYVDDYTTNYGIQLKIDTPNSYFNRIRLYRVYWQNNIDEPTIEIITEDRIAKENLNYTINDSIQQTISTVTQEEFNDIIPYTFQARVMSQYKNRLFFANIEANDWDIPDDYDTRAYRCNYKGNVTLTNTSGNKTTDNVNITSILNNTVIIDKTADCINPMNVLDIYPDQQSDDEYAYDENHNYGGVGLNISFELVKTKTYESEYSAGLSQIEFSNYDNKATADYSASSMTITSPTSTDTYSFGSTQLISYSNPYIASKFASYQRDEVYRFGIVFYNEKFISTPVHWICDIRIPSSDTPGWYPFEINNNHYEVSSIPVGIKFKIKNFPEGAVAAEIVRCDRTAVDRSIVAQGIINNPIQYLSETLDPDRTNSNISNGKNDIRAPFIPTMSLYTQYHGSSDNHNPSTNVQYMNPYAPVKIFASPEVCMNVPSNIIQEGDYMYPVARLIIASNEVQDSSRKVFYADTTNTDHNDMFGSLIDNSTKDFICLYTPDGGNVDTAVLKYYNYESASDIFATRYPNGKNGTREDNGVAKNNSELYIANINQTKLARTDLPVQDNGGIEIFKGTYIDSIGSKQYTNNAVAERTFSIAGVNELLGVDLTEDANHILYNGWAPANASLNAGLKWPHTMLVNIKRRLVAYGGNSYLARSSNGYISCGGYVSKANASTGINVFGGDTFLTIFNYTHAIPFTKNDFSENPISVSGEGAKTVFIHGGVQVYIPIESTINTYMRSDDYFAKLAYNDSVNRFYVQTNPGIINAVTQDVAMYQYNSVYSLSDGAINFSTGTTNENISTTEYNRYRVCCTEQKSAGEEIDSWSITRFANTLDLDFRYGSINNLIDFNSRLYAIQESALSVLSIDDRALITDQNGAELVLGTGGILNRFDIVVYNYGVGNPNDRSVISSSQNIYWYDNNKNVICAFGNNGFHILSKEKKVQSYLNTIAQSNKVEFVSVFNDKQNELWMKTKGISLIYSEQADLFTSFYTHAPNWGLRFYDRLVTLDNRYFYHTDTFGEEDVVKELTAKVTFTVNQDQLYTKVFDNQWIVGNIEDPNNATPHNINSIKFNTKTQDSFEIDYNNVECREDTYRFPIPRQDRGELGSSDENQQDVLNKSFLPRMRGKYLLCKYSFDCDNDRSIQIPFIKTTYRYSRL